MPISAMPCSSSFFCLCFRFCSIRVNIFAHRGTTAFAANISLTKRHVYEMSRLRNVSFTKRHVYQTSRLRNVSFTKRIVYERSRLRNGPFLLKPTDFPSILQLICSISMRPVNISKLNTQLPWQNQPFGGVYPIRPQG